MHGIIVGDTFLQIQQRFSFGSKEIALVDVRLSDLVGSCSIVTIDERIRHEWAALLELTPQNYSFFAQVR